MLIKILQVIGYLIGVIIITGIGIYLINKFFDGGGGKTSGGVDD